MEWIWITLIVLGYFAIGSIISGLGIRWCLIDKNGVLAGLMVVFWPIAIPIALLCAMCIALMDWISEEK